MVYERRNAAAIALANDLCVLITWKKDARCGQSCQQQQQPWAQLHYRFTHFLWVPTPTSNHFPYFQTLKWKYVDAWSQTTNNQTLNSLEYFHFKRKYSCYQKRSSQRKFLKSHNIFFLVPVGLLFFCFFFLLI